MADPAGEGAARVEFGVVNYNGGSAVVRCVESILSQEGAECRVTVFDNASTDGSADAVAAGFPGVVVIQSDRNLGYAGALNRLLGRMTAPVVVLCNMDLRFDPGWASSVWRTLSESDAAGAATLVLEETEPPVVNSVGVRFFGDLHAQNVGSGERYEPDRVAEARERAFGSYGAVMSFRRDAIADLEFDEDYFLFFEETDFLLRLALLGRKTVWADGAIARHERSLSTRRYSPLKLYYGERNRLTTVFKLLPVWYWPAAFLHTLRRLSALARATRARAGAARAGEEAEGNVGDERAILPPGPVILWTLVRAWAAALIRLPGTLRKRRSFWRRAAGTPRDALALLRRYRLQTSELRLR